MNEILWRGGIKLKRHTYINNYLTLLKVEELMKQHVEHDQ